MYWTTGQRVCASQKRLKGHDCRGWVRRRRFFHAVARLASSRHRHNNSSSARARKIISSDARNWPHLDSPSKCVPMTAASASTATWWRGCEPSPNRHALRLWAARDAPRTVRACQRGKHSLPDINGRNIRLFDGHLLGLRRPRTARLLARDRISQSSRRAAGF